MANEFDPFKKKIDEVLNKISSADNMQKIGDLAASIIKKRTRLGFGVEKTESDKQKLKPLDPEYILYRQGTSAEKRTKTGKIQKPRAIKSDKPLTGNFKRFLNKKKPDAKLNESLTSASKSNLTFSGEMLDSLKATGENGKVTIEAAGNHKSGLSNMELVAFNENMGRKFLDLAKADLKQIKDYLESLVDKLLK